MLRPPGTIFQRADAAGLHVNRADGFAEAAQVERRAVLAEPQARDSIERSLVRRPAVAGRTLAISGAGKRAEDAGLHVNLAHLAIGTVGDIEIPVRSADDGVDEIELAVRGRATVAAGADFSGAGDGGDDPRRVHLAHELPVRPRAELADEQVPGLVEADTEGPRHPGLIRRPAVTPGATGGERDLVRAHRGGECQRDEDADDSREGSDSGMGGDLHEKNHQWFRLPSD